MPAMPAPPMPTKWIVADAAHPIVHARASAASRHAAASCLRRVRAAPARARPRPSRRAGRSRRGSSCSARASALGVSSCSAITRPAPARREVPRVARLVIVDRGAERHEDRADADDRELRERDAARARDDEIGPAIRARHVVDERVDARLDAGFRVRLARARRRRYDRPDAKPRAARPAGQLGERARQRLIQDPRAVAAADRRAARRRSCARARRAASRGESLERDRRAAHRVADHLGVATSPGSCRGTPRRSVSRAARAADSSCPRPRSARAAAAAGA